MYLCIIFVITIELQSASGKGAAELYGCRSGHVYRVFKVMSNPVVKIGFVSLGFGQFSISLSRQNWKIPRSACRYLYENTGVPLPGSQARLVMYICTVGDGVGLLQVWREDRRQKWTPRTPWSL